MGILIKVIESQSCTSIIPSEWGPGKTKKASKVLFNFFNFQDFQYPGTSSTNRMGWKLSPVLCKETIPWNCQWMNVPGADLYSAFTLLLYKEEMRVTERKDPAEEWKRSQPWLAMINPAPQYSTALVLALLPSRKGLIPKACFLLQSSQILICMKMDFRRRREKTAPWPPHLFSSQSNLKNILIIAWQFSQAGQLM